MSVATRPEAHEPDSSLDPSASTTHARPRKKGTKHAHTKAAITSHVDLNSQLLDAVQQERPRVVRRLLDSKADPSTLNSSNESPLILACSVQNEEARSTIVRQLLKKGAEVNIQDRSGQTALMKAVIRNDAVTTFALLDSHADVSLQDREGNNVLCHAALHGNEDIVQRMIDEFKTRKLDVDKRNMRGLTPLLIACQEGNVQCARVLVLEGGASPKIRDLDNFMTAEEWMRSSGVSCSSPELTFLSPATRKRNYYRKQRQLKGMKTLSDYPLPVDLDKKGSTSTPNTFCVRQEVERDGIRQKGNPVLPGIVDTSPAQVRSFSLISHSGPSPSSPSKSMFDFSGTKPDPPLSLPHKKAAVPIRRPLSKPEVPFSMVKADLYHSPYLAQRQCYLSRDRRSEYYKRGSLQPLDFNAREKLSQLQAREEQKRRSTAATRHNALPPLKKHSQKLS